MTVEQTGPNPALEPGPAELSVRSLSNQQLSFENLLDEVCERLQDTRHQGSLKRILKLEETLNTLTRELDELIDCQTSPASANEASQE